VNTPLIMVPGMMCDARLFAPQIAAIAPRHRVDVPLPTGADTIAALAAAILATAPPRFALAGLSMGGIVAMQIVAQAPERVAGLALLDTNHLAETPEVKARRLPQMARVQAGELAAVMREEMKPNYLADSAHRADILDLCAAMAQGLGADAFLDQSQALMTRPDHSATLAGFHGPALVLCGRQDRLCPPARHLAMQALMPHARLAIIDGAGHLPCLEQPDITTGQLLAWLKETENG
jgi:pimeloyl-ACP methyl ester carboxylesterase